MRLWIYILGVLGLLMLGRLTRFLPDKSLDPNELSSVRDETSDLVNEQGLFKTGTFLTFEEAKKNMRIIYLEHPQTFYCGCQIQDKYIDHKLCGFQSIKPSRRSHLVEWEHVVAASHFGRSFSVWTKGHSSCKKKDGQAFRGRACAKKMSKEYQGMEGNMHNLVPVIGEVNHLRYDYRFTEIGFDGHLEPVQYFGDCKSGVSTQAFYPKESVRGAIARIHFYMAHRYPKRFKLTENMDKLFHEWDLKFPCDDWELRRDKKIALIQGDRNLFVKRCEDKVQ